MIATQKIEMKKWNGEWRESKMFLDVMNDTPTGMASDPHGNNGVTNDFISQIRKAAQGSILGRYF